MIHFKDIEFLSVSGDQIELFSKKTQNFSILSLDLIDAILNKRVVIIFSQGPLNITPFISCLFALTENDNVLIGLPKHTFQEKYKEYTTEYFSLLYKKILNSVITNPIFFYQDIIWCKGKIDENNNELFDLIIEKYPVHGKTNYKKIYENSVIEKLNKGNYNNNPKIVLIPIDHSIPSNIIGLKRMQFKNANYDLKNFNPGLIILESINERSFRFDSVKQLIKRTEEMNIKLVLHFSWPYLSGLHDFLSDPDIGLNSAIEIFHFGKRFCIQSKDKFQKPPLLVLPLSLEGKIWDTIYYSEKPDISKISIMVIPNHNDDNGISINSLISIFSTVDKRIHNIRSGINFEMNIDNFTKNILLFPIVIDSFLLPSEIKVRAYIERLNSVRYIPIEDFLKKSNVRDSISLQSYLSLCLDVESSRDISCEMRGLMTFSALNKKTLLQIHIIEKVHEIVKNFELNPTSKETTENVNIVIPKLHPFFETRKNNLDSLHYFFQGFPYLLGHIILPRIVKKLEDIVIKWEKVEIPLFEGKSLKIPPIDLISKNIDPNKKYPIEISINKESEFLEIFVKLKIQATFIKIEDIEKMQCKKEFSCGLDLFYVKIRSDGQYIETSLSEFVDENKFHLNSVNYRAKYITRINSLLKTNQINISIEFADLSTICQYPQEKFVNSSLFISGPIPFQTITSREIFISQGYNVLLLPFKNIVFFAFPGRNLQRIVKQLALYKDLFSDIPTEISNLDLHFSVEQMKKSKRYEFPEKSQIGNSISQIIAPNDTIFDAAIRKELMDISKATDEEKEEIVSLREIWDRIGKKKPLSPYDYELNRSDALSVNREQINLKIVFENGTEDNISFSKGTLIRKRSGDDYSLIQVDDLAEDDEILYIETTERESIDNFLLRDFASEKGISLEQIFEPFYCLKLFYEILNSIDFFTDYASDIMKNIYWLNNGQKMALFKTLKILLNKQGFSQLEEQLQDNNNIWKYHISADQLIQIFTEGRNRITYEKLFKIVKMMGMSLVKDTFKQYCTIAIKDNQHYYFNRDEDLRALGYLLGHSEIINNYQIINDQGRNVGTILQIIGRCISRVTGGKSDQLNEMDTSIEGKVKKCKIVSVSYPQ